MSKPITHTDITQMIMEALADCADEYDVKGIADDLIAAADRRHDYDDHLFWPIVERHHIGPPDSACAQRGTRSRMAGRLDRVGQVAAWADDAIDEALLAGVPVAEVARRTGRDRAGLHRRRARVLGLRASVDTAEEV